MKQNKILIEVCEGSTLYKVDIKEATQAERFDYYNKVTKGKVIQMLEALGNFNKTTGGNI
jgi:hypothetical protein